MYLTELDPCNQYQKFPSVSKALVEPNGLLAVGGCLSVPRLLNAYQQGIFPWYNPDEPILWWSPNPRLVLFPERVKISKSLHKTIRKQLFEIRYDSVFTQVMAGCAAPRAASQGTWINSDMIEAYSQLFQYGYAHCFEAWQADELVGGLYGVAVGQAFFGESMFHCKTDASKVVFVEMVKQLVVWGYRLIDCQVSNPHLVSLGAGEIPRSRFIELLGELCIKEPNPEAWTKK